MRKFNPEKELSKIRNGNKKKIIISICALLVVGVLGYSFALYQVRHTQKLVFNTVGEFKKRDIYLSVLVDGETKSEFPGKDDGYVFERLDCDKEGTSATFDKDTWELVLRTNKPNKCTVVFGSKPNEPELFQGLIPITIGDDGTIKVADTDSEWYDYGQHKWANAVLVTTEKYNELTQGNQLRKDKAGTVLNLDTDILQMYVWIPRYKYQLWNVNNESKPKQIINIQFEKETETTGDITCTYTNNNDGNITESCVNKEGKEASNGDWYTHPAFTFKGTTETSGTELRGIWVGKFEPSDPTNQSGRKNGDNIKEITILPNKSSIVWKTVNSMFNTSIAIGNEKATKYNLNSNTIDIHVMKNIDWGAVVYLTQSTYGIYKNEETCNIKGLDYETCEVWINNVAQGTGTEGTYSYGGAATGCVGNTVNAAVEWNTDGTIPAICPEGRRWNEKGVNASTTGNIYGIYDMNGGGIDLVMGVLVAEDTGTWYPSASQIEQAPEAKYYDIYSYDNKVTSHNRGHLGDATREILTKFGNTTGGWNSNEADFAYGPVGTWFTRGGRYYNSGGAGIFAFAGGYGGVNSYGATFRIVLTAQDVVD